MNRVADEDIYPRDIFACLKGGGCNQPIRGWKLTFGGPGITFNGSVDWETGVITAEKGKDKRYFWYKVAEGIEGKTGQSLSEMRVKQLDSPDEDPYENRLMRTALWSDDHSVAWEPSRLDPNVGWCIDYPLSNLSMSSWPVTKADCESRKGYSTTDDKGKSVPLPPVVLKPYKETKAAKERQ